MMAEELSNEVKDLIMDKKFLSYIFDPSSGRAAYWALYLKSHPENTDSFNRAKYILQHLDSIRSSFREDELTELKIQIRECMMHCHVN